jgi:hypothetical protein
MKGILSLNMPRALTRPAMAEETGRILNAQQFADEICGGHVSAKYVIKHFAAAIGSKPGKEWLFHEGDARREWLRVMPRKQGAA